MRSILAVVGLLLAFQASAEIRSEAVSYRDGDTDLTGWLYWDDAAGERRPGVMVVHEWWGLNDYARKRARMLAELGYVAFAADMYGDDRVTEHAADAQGWMQQITANVEAWQRRALRGLEVLRASERVDEGRLAAIGYCFGGATVMQMAYAGADLDGVVSFHGSLPAATEEQQQKIRTHVLAAHGAADSFVPREKVAAFTDALSAAGVDWEMDVYGGARHGFTNPEAAKYGLENVQYDPVADRRSWARMRDFLAEVFAP
ncbi:MAG: dienelactone hydrolase family protein [Chromatiales bacterium]|jgi:dienelactone hydrolase